METHVVSDLAWQRMVTAVDKVRDRLRRATAQIPYAVAGDNAVAAWVSEVDEAAVRNTQDVDILIRRTDFDKVKEALARAGFVYRQTDRVDLFLDSPSAHRRHGVRVHLADDQFDFSKTRQFKTFRALSLDPLVCRELTSFSANAAVNVRDLIDVGLVDASWRDRLPTELADRLQTLLDNPEG
jgi:hypothetical protein